jgi:putative FmdB family regulatory protein
MPIYEYHCGDCEAKFEELVTSTEEIPSCPSCGGGQVTKKLSIFASTNNAGAEKGNYSYCNSGLFR